jgi:hypothetical protein
MYSKEELNAILQRKGGLTEVEEFKIRNDLTDAQYEYLLLLHSLKRKIRGVIIRFPGGDKKLIK